MLRITFKFLALALIISLLAVCTNPSGGPTDAEAIAAVRAALQIGYTSPDTENSVTADIVLPKTGENDVAISWKSSDSSAIAADGTVTRPAFTEEDKRVILTATISRGGASVTKAFFPTVERELPDDAVAVDIDSLALRITYADGDTEDAVTSDFTLPGAGLYDSVITWVTTNPAIEIVNPSADGGSYTARVSRPPMGDEDETGELIAAIFRGSKSDIRVFHPVVVAPRLPAITGDFAYTMPLTIVYGAGAEIGVDSNTITETDVTFTLDPEVLGVRIDPSSGTITVKETLAAGVHPITVKADSPGTEGSIGESYEITVSKKLLTGETLSYAALTAVKDAVDGTAAAPNTAGLLVSGDTLADALTFSLARLSGPGPEVDSGVSIDAATGLVTVETGNVFAKTSYTVTAAAKADGNYTGSTSGTIDVAVMIDLREIGGDFSHQIPPITYGTGAVIPLSSNILTGNSVEFILSPSVTGIEVEQSTGRITVEAGLAADTYPITIKASSADTAGTVDKTYDVIVAKKPIPVEGFTYSPLTVDRGAAVGISAAPDAGTLTASLVSGDGLADAVTFTIARIGGSGPAAGSGVSIESDTGVVLVDTASAFAATVYKVTASAKAAGNYTGSSVGFISVTVETPAIGGNFAHNIPVSIAYGDGAAISLAFDNLTGPNTPTEFALAAPVEGIEIESNGEITVRENLAAGTYRITVQASSADTTGTVDNLYDIAIEAKPISSAALSYASLKLRVGAATGKTAAPTYDFLVPGDSLSDAATFTIARSLGPGPEVNQGVSIDAATGLVTVETGNDFGETRYTITAAAKGNYVGSVDGSFDVEVTYDDVPPGQPTNFSAAVVNGEVTLSWDEPASKGYFQGTAAALTRYTIYYSDSPGVTAANNLGSEIAGTAERSRVFAPSSPLAAGSQYYFIMTARNGTGESPPTSEVSAFTDAVPGVPTGVSTMGGDGQVTLSWTAPASRGYYNGVPASLGDYTIYYSTNSNVSTSSSSVTAGPDRTSRVVDSLNDGTQYYFLIRASNGAGDGLLTPAAPTFTDAVPGEPTGVSAMGGSGKASLSWTAPDSRGYHSGVEASLGEYRIYYSASANVSTSDPSIPAASDETSKVVNNLFGGTQYYFLIRASNGTGDGPLTAPVSTFTDAVPGAPTNVSAIGGNGQVTLSWDAPAFEGYYRGTAASLDDYTIYYSTSANVSTSSSSVTADSGKTSKVVSGLNGGTQYYFMMRASNGGGNSPLTSKVSTFTDAAPGVPTGVSARGGNGQVTLSWSAPAFTGYDSGVSASLSDYRIYYSASANVSASSPSVTAGSDETSKMVNNLNGGTQYYFRMTASNGAGEGSLTSPVSTFTDAAPGAPTIRVSTTQTGVKLDWEVSDTGYDGGTEATLTRIDIYYADSANVGLVSSQYDGTTSIVTSNPIGSENITIDAPGTPYYFIATAANTVGVSTASSEQSVTLNSRPGVPASVSGTVTDTTVTLNWAAPTYTGYYGGALTPLTDYSIYYSKTASFSISNPEGTETAGSGDTSITVTGLTAGTTYYFIMTASNAAGKGVETNPLPMIPGIKPDSPASVSAAAGHGEVTLNWAAPVNKGTPPTLTGYTVYYSTDANVSTAAAAKVMAGPGDTSMVVPGLKNRTLYYFIITASNNAGESNAANAVSATPLADTFSYGTADAVRTLKDAEFSVMPTWERGTVPDGLQNYEISPSTLPAGITFNFSTGELEGTPTALAIKDYTITAHIGGEIVSTPPTTLLVYARPTGKNELVTLLEAEINRQGSNGDFQTIDTSSITDMSDLFNPIHNSWGAEFNGDISSWDVSNVTNMATMFFDASQFNQDIGGWDVGNVENMQGMFFNASQFNQNIGGWNVGKVTNMGSMFGLAAAFDQNLENWAVSPSSINPNLDRSNMFTGSGMAGSPPTWF